MHTLTHPLITAHGLKRVEADLRDWRGHLKLHVQRSIDDHKKNREIARILQQKRAGIVRHKRTGTSRPINLPPVWSHKIEARAGDTIYLRHKDTIRSFMLTAAGDADATNGRVSIASPIGLMLAGRHPGDTVHIHTLDSDAEYQIVKIV